MLSLLHVRLHLRSTYVGYLFLLGLGDLSAFSLNTISSLSTRIATFTETMKPCNLRPDYRDLYNEGLCLYLIVRFMKPNLRSFAIMHVDIAEIGPTFKSFCYAMIALSLFPESSRPTLSMHEQ